MHEIENFKCSTASFTTELEKVIINEINQYTFYLVLNDFMKSTHKLAIKITHDINQIKPVKLFAIYSEWSVILSFNRFKEIDWHSPRDFPLKISLGTYYNGNLWGYQKQNKKLSTLILPSSISTSSDKTDYKKKTIRGNLARNFSNVN